MMIKLDYYPDVAHEHDYHTAILPALCKLRYNAIESIRNIRHILTIHNLAYQGEYDKQVLFDCLAFDYKYYENGFGFYVSLPANDYPRDVEINEYFFPELDIKEIEDISFENYQEINNGYTTGGFHYIRI